jgi:hypothetical protein
MFTSLIARHARDCLFVTLMIIGAIASPLSLAAQEGPPSVDRVIELHRKGISESVLIGWIKQANTPVKLSADDLVKLTDAKVPERVVNAIMNPVGAFEMPLPAAPASTPSTVVVAPTGVPMATAAPVSRPSGATTDDRTAAGDPNDPMSPHDSGIYLFETEPAVKMTFLEQTAYTGSKTSSFMHQFLTELIPATTRALIPGGEASIRATTKDPAFYFYFEDRAGGLGKINYFGGVTTPNQVVLVKLEKKKNARETTIRKESLIGGSSGTHGAVQFKAERLKAGLYKVTIPQGMAPGEYAFMVSANIVGAQQAGAASPIQIFDFGVDVLK